MGDDTEACEEKKLGKVTSRAQIVIEVRCRSIRFIDCLGYTPDDTKCSNLCKHFDAGKCSNYELVHPKVEESPYNNTQSELWVRERDFDTIYSMFQWDLNEHCPPVPERQFIAAIIKDAVDKAKELTKKLPEQGKHKTWK